MEVLGAGVVAGVGAAAGEAVAATRPLSCRREGGVVAVGLLPLVALLSVL